MNKLYIKLLCSGVVLLQIASCAYLDLKPKHGFTGTDMLKTYDDAVAAVNGIYVSLLDNPEEFGGNMFVGLSTRAGITEWNGNEKTVYYEETYPASSSIVMAKDLWFQLMKGVNYSNFAINGIAEMPKTAFKEETLRTKLIAEARLCRAWFNIHQLYHYAQWWEVDENIYGILYRNKVSELTNINLARLTVGESYAVIIEDLDEAIVNCPTLDEFKSNKKMSKEYAKVLKAKLLLIRGTSHKRNSESDMLEAKKLVDELFSNMPKSWELESDMKQMYTNSFDSKENLFVRFDINWQKNDRNGGFTYGYGLGYIPAESNNGVLNSNGLDLAFDYEKADAGIKGKSLSFMKTDPRWKITTAIQQNPETWDKGSRYAVWKLYRDGFNNKPLCDLKFNIYYFRLYELYLLKAELILRTGGSYTIAMDVINDVRSKRTNPELPPLTAANTEAAYRILYQEFVNELYMENGADYFAALRFKSPDGDNYVEYNKKSDDVKMTWIKQIFPIPNEEMNNKLMIQNEGY